NESEEARATYYYAREKKWNAIDHILMGKSLLNGSDLQYVTNSFQRVSNETNTLKQGIKIGRKFLPAGAPVPFVVRSETDGVMDVIGASDLFPVSAVFEVLQ